MHRRHNQRVRTAITPPLVVGASFPLWHAGVLALVTPATTMLVIVAALALAGVLLALAKRTLKGITPVHDACRRKRM